MPVGEGWVVWIGTIHQMFVLSPLDSGKTIFSKSPLEGGKTCILAYLRVANHLQNEHAMFCSNLGDLGYTCLLHA